jgi:hypothetical protein
MPAGYTGKGKIEKKVGIQAFDANIHRKWERGIDDSIHSKMGKGGNYADALCPCRQSGCS